MRDVSSDYINTVESGARARTAYVKYDSTTIEANELQGINIEAKGNLNRLCIRKLELSHEGEHNLLDKEVEVFIGLQVGGDFEYVNYGKFDIKKVEFDATGITTAIGYDKLYQTLRRYNGIIQAFPMTVGDFLGYVLDNLGLTLTTTTFPNSDYVLEADSYSLKGWTYREVINQIAEVSGCIVRMAGGEVELIQPNIESDFELNTSFAKAMAIESKWGDVNSVRVSFAPVRSNFFFIGGYANVGFYLMDDEGFLLMNDEEFSLMELAEESEELYQIHFIGNEIYREAPDDLLVELGNVFLGYSYHPFEVETTGLGIFDVGDKITLKDKDGDEFETTVFEFEIDYSTTGYKEVILAGEIEKRRDTFEDNAGVVEGAVNVLELEGKNIRDDSVSSAKISSITADKIETGVLGVNTTIIVRDEFGDDRILIGYQKNGF